MAHQNPRSSSDSSLPNFGNMAFDIISPIAQGLALFNPDLAGIFRSPLFGFLETNRLGRANREALERVRPNLERVPLGTNITSTTGPEGRELGISLPSIGAQAIRERVDTFDALNQLGSEQRREIANFRLQLNDTFSGLQEADRMLQNAGLTSAVQLRKGLKDIANLRRNTLNFIAAGLRESQLRLDEIASGNKEVLDNIDTDIADRLASLNSGITARGNASFRQTASAIDSVAPMAPEERAALRSYFDFQIGSDMALAGGALHEEAVEFKAGVASNLQQSSNDARTQTIASTGQLISTGIDAFSQAETLSVSLRQTHSDNVKTLAIAGSELKQFAASFVESSAKTLFDMVSQVARPVLVFSDIMGNLFDTAFDVIAHNNNVDQQLLANEMAILGVEFSAALAALNGLTRAQERDEDRDLVRGQGSLNRTTQLATAAITGGSDIAAAGAKPGG